MHVPFKFQTAYIEANETALIDSGATENFIDEESFKCLGVGKRQLENPIKILNVNGMENQQGEVNHFCRLRVRHNEKEGLQDFFITDLGKDRIILRYPFLEAFNLQMDWTKGRLKGGPVTIQSMIFKHLDSMIQGLQKKARQTGTLQPDEAFYIRRMMMSQKMAHDYQPKTKKEVEVLVQYRLLGLLPCEGTKGLIIHGATPALPNLYCSLGT